jgi:hypothetical protein
MISSAGCAVKRSAVPPSEDTSQRSPLHEKQIVWPSGDRAGYLRNGLDSSWALSVIDVKRIIKMMLKRFMKKILSAND